MSRERLGVAALLGARAMVWPVHGAAAAVLVLVVASFVVGAKLGDPHALAAPERIVGPRVVDRDGGLLREPLAARGQRGRWVTLDEVSPHLVAAVLAAEDHRFRDHPGVDVLAVGRAALQNLRAGRVVSGGSTITQQLVKQVLGRTRDRDLAVKLEEMAAALHFERAMDKRSILEAYLNWVPMGHLERGVERGARAYFGKPAAHLSLAEAAALAALIRGPGAFCPDRHPGRLESRRLWVLERMRAGGAIDDAQLAHARAHPPRFARGAYAFEAPHLAEEVLRRTRARRLVPGVVTTTIDGDLQRRTETVTRRVVEGLEGVDVSTAAVVVIHNRTGEVRAWVGSSGYFDAEALGMNDGVTARRSPGSALKPFVYGEALERGATAATMIPDVPAAFPTTEGTYRPRNYDGAFRGPVLLRDALGSSLNVPAVVTAADLGPATVLAALHRAGFSSLDEEPAHYGAAIALGDGEVTLLELAAAYAALARGGTWIEPVLVRGVEDARGRPLALEGASSRRVFSPATAFLLAHILADPAARRTGFGEARVFDLGFPVSVKTGTSHDYRDNWAVGFTDEHTVGAWVGNFDGTPMGNISGITGAGPLFAAVVVEVSQDGAAPPAPPGSIVTRRVCPVSGALPGPACPDAREELFVRGREPVAACSIHQLLEVDSRNGLLATESCPEDIVERRAFEVYPASMAVWAQKAGRNVPPPASDLCPQAPRNVGAEPVRILEPPDGAVFALEPDIPPGDQAIEVRFTPPPAGGPVTLLVDGEVAARVDGAPWRVLWGPVAGEHALAAAAAGAAGEPVVVQVE